MVVRILTFCFLLVPVLSFTQGSFVLIGGGSEKDEAWSWSNEPYSWMLEQSDGSKVAIVSYQSSTDPEWLVNYFLHLGAQSATNFVFTNRSEADDEDVNSLLKDYDVVFLKGGDQSEYYRIFNETRVEESIIQIFERGGVIAGTSAGMAILSNPFFSAENGTLYPDEALEDTRPEEAVFREDFLPFNVGFLFDTHFLERGRHVRLMSFLGQLIETDPSIVGVGVDDQTALCIDKDGKAVVFGTGAVSFVVPDSFKDTEGKPAGTFSVLQLIHGDQIDINTLNPVLEHELVATPQSGEIPGTYDLFLAGSTSLGENQFWLREQLQEDTLVIITSPGSELASDYAKFLDDEISNVTLLETDPGDTCSRSSDINLISRSPSFLWIDNELESLSAFLATDPAGKHLRQVMYRDGLKHFFIGQDTDLAGAKIASNRLTDDLASYLGMLEFTDGLGLAGDMLIVGEIYDPEQTTYYENNTSSLLYGILNERLEYALGLNERSFAHIRHSEGNRILTVHGKYSALLLSNKSDQWASGSQPVNSTGNVRQVAGFERMLFDIVSSDPKILSTSIARGAYQPVSLLQPVEELAYDFDANGMNISWQHAGPIAAESFVIRFNDEVIAQLGGEARAYTWENFQNGKITITAVSGNMESCPATLIDYVTSAEDNQDGDLVPVPNPVSGNGFRLSGIPNGPGTLHIYDISGHEVLSREVEIDENISISGLPDGLYILRYSHSKNAMIRKIIIRRN